ncbi:hypothetical protein [Enterococcus mundtii]|uniref:hypothetical protein n=1 Tax=Enterococcus mundtii TaxID=53346 RepID=UPI0015E27E1D|nr:hypothetical protein [Enterococcus mundtii]
MILTDEIYRFLSEYIYWTDPKHPKHNKNFREGSIKVVEGYKFKILKLKENSKTDGMQAMAVGPLDEKGNVSTSQVVISYAETNISDFKDIETDLRTISEFFDKTVVLVY